MQDASIGDTFRDIRSEGPGSVTIVDIAPAGPCFLLRQSDKPEWLPCFYVTNDRFLEITGGHPRICRIHQKHMEEVPEEDPKPIDETALIPAETLTAHIHHQDDGGVKIEFYAWADVWRYTMGCDPRALRNEVVGRLFFEEASIRIAPSAARLIEGAIYPYRLSPDTRVSAHLFPGKRRLVERVRLKLFGGPAFIPGDDLTLAVEAEMQKLADSAPPADIQGTPSATAA